MSLTRNEVDAARIVDALSTLLVLSDMVPLGVFEMALEYIKGDKYCSLFEERAARWLLEKTDSERRLIPGVVLPEAKAGSPYPVRRSQKGRDIV